MVAVTTEAAERGALRSRQVPLRQPRRAVAEVQGPVWGIPEASVVLQLQSETHPKRKLAAARVARGRMVPRTAWMEQKASSNVDRA